MKQSEIYNRTKVDTERRGEPIHLDEAKDHLKILSNDEDGKIEGAIAAARRTAENLTWRSYELQTYKLYLDDFPTVIELEPAPVRSVESVEYLLDGNTETVPTSTYHVDKVSEPARIVLANEKTWPSPDDRPNAVIVTFKAGYEVKFTIDDNANEVTATDHWFSDDDVVRVRVSGGNNRSAPGGLSLDTDYHVINSSGDTLQLATSQGGSAIDITSTDTGQFYLYEPPRLPSSDINGMLLLVGHLYENREDVIVSNSTLNIQNLPNGAKFLLGLNSMSRPV